MKDNPALTLEAFDLLLRWLDQNRDAAGEKYEKIRHKLIRVLSGRGCHEADALVDETINRVTRALPRIIESYSGEPALYFYGVANNVHHEWLRQQNRKVLHHIPPSPEDPEDSEPELNCLDECLKDLSAPHRTLILEYYREEKGGKIRHRKAIAESLGLETNALQVRASRIRAQLRNCVTACLSGREA